ncbi:type IV toxin-antitoxin system AbiEi family antitoxin domain-containing protein [Microbacterium sp. GXF7504]
MRHIAPDDLGEALIPGARLRAQGMSDRALAREVDAGTLVRVHRGWYLPATVWDELWSESRHLARVIAADRTARGSGPVFCGVSAACLWGLPLHHVAPRRVHVFSPGADRHSTPDLLRHEGVVPEEDIAERHGMRCTSLARTVTDCIRILSEEAGIALADAALALVGGDPRAFDDGAADTLLDELARRVAAPGARGIRRARWIVSLADGRAQLPLESVTRLQLVRLGFRRPRLQVPVPDPRGGEYRVDIGLDDVGAFCEVDGRTKYLDESLRSGLELEEVLLREKQREDWIRGTTQRRLARVEAEHVTSPGILRTRLAAFGIRPLR